MTRDTKEAAGKGMRLRGHTAGPGNKAALVGWFLLLAILPDQAAEKFDGQLSNNAIAWCWHWADGKFQNFRFDDKLNDGELNLAGDAFQLVLDDGTILKSSDFTILAPPKIEKLRREPNSPVQAKHFPGRQLVARFSSPKNHLTVEWRVLLRDGSAYVRQQLTLHATDKNVFIKKIVLFQQKISGAKTDGTVEGSPVVAGNFFFGYEQPMAENTVDSNNVVRCFFQRNAVLKAGETLTQSCVVGVTPAGQLRRGFQAYLERERSRPYRPFLHYNSWYDIAWVDRKFNADECVNAIRQIGDELIKKRGMKIDSFLFDDGWDNDRTLWQFNAGFPDGFAPVEKEAKKFHAGIGVWLSPFGGYSQAKSQRLKYAGQFGFETNASGFSLAGPKYFQRFHDICLNMIQKYGVNAFKFDGLAAGARAGENGLTRDGDAMLRLIADLRAAEPGLYINQTTGTWPSPFWLLYVDSIWRGGRDHWFAGQGDWCQRWMTYRDAQTYQNVVKRAPLYPLNSLMTHGIIYATHADHLNQMNDADFADQIRAYFGSGTQLQELYITPQLLDEKNWDVLAGAAKWSRANAGVLADTHWVGGDPGKNEIYGWASWSPRKAILTLRNPADQPASFTADAAKLFELPSNAKKVFYLRRPWKTDHNLPALEIRAGEPHTFNLQPFEVLVLESK
jgi:hypothetical protein